LDIVAFINDVIIAMNLEGRYYDLVEEVLKNNEEK